MPTTGDTFEVVTFNNRGGTTFDSVTGSGAVLQVNYNATDVTLEAN